MHTWFRRRTRRPLNRRVSRSNIRQTAENQRIPPLPSKVLNSKPVKFNFSHHFLNRQNGILCYAPSTQPQQADTFLNYPPSQVQQINPPYRNNDCFGLQKPLAPLALRSVQATAHMVSRTYQTTVQANLICIT